MGILHVLFTLVFLAVCVLMVMIVLLQPSQGEGLGSAFGGGISESFFGTRAMNWLARATIVLVLVYLALAVGLNKLPRPADDGSQMPASVMPEPESESKPAEAAPGAGTETKPADAAPPAETGTKPAETVPPAGTGTKPAEAAPAPGTPAPAEPKPGSP